jgi:heat shock protein HtpX
MAAITALLVVCGYFIGGNTGIYVAVVMAIVMNFGSYWFSDKMVIAMTRAKPVAPSQAPELYEMVERMSKRANIPMPSLYVVEDPSPNAFATGRSPERGVVAVNSGLLNILNREEVEGVIAHELAHIKHRDTLTMAIVATMAGAISSLGHIMMFASMFGGHRSEDGEEGGGGLGMLFMIIVAPIAAMMIQMGVSRLREYEADKTGAMIAGTPVGLRNALVKLHNGVEHVPGHINPSAAHLCIINPFGSRAASIAALFSTHPPVQERIRKLDELPRSIPMAAA